MISLTYKLLTQIRSTIICQFKISHTIFNYFSLFCSLHFLSHPSPHSLSTFSLSFLSSFCLYFVFSFLIPLCLSTSFLVSLPTFSPLSHTQFFLSISHFTFHLYIFDHLLPLFSISTFTSPFLSWFSQSTFSLFFDPSFSFYFH